MKQCLSPAFGRPRVVDAVRVGTETLGNGADAADAANKEGIA